MQQTMVEILLSISGILASLALTFYILHFKGDEEELLPIAGKLGIAFLLCLSLTGVLIIKNKGGLEPEELFHLMVGITLAYGVIKIVVAGFSYATGGCCCDVRHTITAKGRIVSGGLIIFGVAAVMILDSTFQNKINQIGYTSLCELFAALFIILETLGAMMMAKELNEKGIFSSLLLSIQKYLYVCLLFLGMGKW